MNRNTWIKICGLARSDEVARCFQLGVDAVGVLVVPDDHTDRKNDQLTVDQAASLLKHAPDGLQTVILTKSRQAEEISRICRSVDPDWVQVQAEVPDEELIRLSTDVRSKFIKKISVEPERSFVELSGLVRRAQEAGLYEAVLLDTAVSKGGRGGTGTIHDWHLSAKLVDEYPDNRFILAGGLTPCNVSDAVKTVHPWGVDVMSGVSLGSGLKDLPKVAEFVRAVRTLDAGA